MDKYKLSKYNFFKKKKDKVIGVNLFDKRMFSVDIQLYDKLIFNKETLNSLEADDPLFFSTMYKLGVIEDEETDIPAILLVRNRERVLSTEHYRLIILPTLNCNFSCWYCYQTRARKIMDTNTVDNIIKYIRHLIINERISTLQLDWFGGEPLLGFEKVIKPIAIEAKELSDKYNVRTEMSMTSNGFLINEEMISFFQEHNMVAAQITLDGDEDVHNRIRFHGKQKKATYRTIVKNISEVARIMYVILRINYTRESIDTCIAVIDLIPEDIRQNIEVNLVQVWQDTAKNTKQEHILLKNKQAEVYRKFNVAGFKIMQKQVKSKNEYTCYADLKNSAVINYDGRVFKCTATNFKESSEDGILTEDGIIVWDEQKIAKRIGRATFDNEFCMNCQYLPICTGFCSNKPALTSSKCFLKKIYEKDIDELIEKFNKHDYKLAHLSQL